MNSNGTKIFVQVYYIVKTVKLIKRIDNILLGIVDSNGSKFLDTLTSNRIVQIHSMNRILTKK